MQDLSKMMNPRSSDTDFFDSEEYGNNHDFQLSKEQTRRVVKQAYTSELSAQEAMKLVPKKIVYALARLRIAFPVQKIVKNDEEVLLFYAVWGEVFKETPEKRLNEAIIRYVTDCENGFFPSPGQIMGMVRTIEREAREKRIKCGETCINCAFLRREETEYTETYPVYKSVPEEVFEEEQVFENGKFVIKPVKKTVYKNVFSHNGEQKYRRVKFVCEGKSKYEGAKIDDYYAKKRGCSAFSPSQSFLERQMRFGANGG